jgi:hypothetical protein
LSKDQLFFCLRAALEAASVEFKIQFKEGKKKRKKQNETHTHTHIKKGAIGLEKARVCEAKQLSSTFKHTQHPSFLCTRKRFSVI